ncbi:hypothetical protein JJL56_30440 [Azospirillum sp. YIM DDC1]|uniref:Sporadic carbohydrate cluster 2OG-Fe(II) oxygenase n=1 Tax=Azospirillum aestuarii TaxID=2802052 RepID=A0ABS1I877_9PROT|nr:sporadic carbohydrate cluster 2OG-Fe(II) oxygenase [Azospirillum aestuarii]MBK4723176.1 hypothetical protein [Azospirillum aestuarii]
MADPEDTPASGAAPSFFRPEEEELIGRFFETGYVIAPVEDRGALDRIRDRLAKLAAAHLGRPAPEEPGLFLDRIHEHVTAQTLNELRLAAIQGINAEGWLRPSYFALARRTIEAVAGNELAMQKRINLSVQLPDDDSSLLPVHADVWSGDAPSEVVLWLPLVDCHRTKSMYIAERRFDERTQAGMAAFQGRSAEDLYRTIEPHLTFLDVPYGHCLLFTQNLMHGNRVNREATTRWSMNCRFKALLSPYADKRLGEFFEPITMRPATRLGLTYRMPEGFHE